MTLRRAASRPMGRSNAGFSLIEVLITILIMGIGLLAFALMQTMNLRFSQSANYRTQATNLAYDMLDQMRMNRRFAVQYTAATFTGGAAVPCDRPVGNTAVLIPANVTRWQCQVRATLGEGSAANVLFDPATGQATVALTWGDERWQPNAANRNKTVTVGSTL